MNNDMARNFNRIFLFRWVHRTSRNTNVGWNLDEWHDETNKLMKQIKTNTSIPWIQWNIYLSTSYHMDVACLSALSFHSCLVQLLYCNSGVGVPADLAKEFAKEQGNVSIVAVASLNPNRTKITTTVDYTKTISGSKKHLLMKVKLNPV